MNSSHSFDADSTSP